MASKTKRKKRKVTKCYSGIGGQAVLEGIMMKNNDRYSVAVRRGDGSIAVDIESCNESWRTKTIAKIPFIRGIFNFVGSLILGIRSLNYSAEIYGDEETVKDDDSASIFVDPAKETPSETLLGNPAEKVSEEVTEMMTGMESEDGQVESSENTSDMASDSDSSKETNSDPENKATETAAEKEKTKTKAKSGSSNDFTGTITGIIAVLIAVGLFMVLPVYITKWVTADIRNESLIAIIEGGIRLGIFLLYIILISLMKDIRRVYMYHGAEHKCINCIERGRPLTVKNVMRSSRMHKRCGTSFLLFVVVVSIIVFFFIRVDNMALKVLLRIALIPVIAGISYEILRLAGKYDNIIVNILSAPGMLLQMLTTREPDEKMVEVAICAVEAVFDWKKFQKESFGYDREDDETVKQEEEQRAAIEHVYDNTGELPQVDAADEADIEISADSGEDLPVEADDNTEE